MTNLILIGYRGTGKTVLGLKVAGKLGLDFVDTDNLIVEIAGKSIPKIFEEDGEEKFREIETRALEKALEGEGKVISCGGGIITQERNFPLLEKGVVCLLKAGANTIFERIYKDSNRPALTDKNPKEEIIHLLEVRKPMYERAKDFEINTEKNKWDCVEEIIKGFEELKAKKW
jgi:shikimate kinase